MATRIEYRALWTYPLNPGTTCYTTPTHEPSYQALYTLFPFEGTENDQVKPTLLGWQKRTVIESDWEDYT